MEEVKVKSRGRDESAGHVQWNARFARRLQPPSRSSSVALLLCEAYTSISSKMFPAYTQSTDYPFDSRSALLSLAGSVVPTTALKSHVQIPTA